MDLKLKPRLRQLLVFRACTHSNQKKNSNTESESWEDEKFDESKYGKKVDALGLRSANPEILPVYPNPKQRPNIVVVVGKQLQSINFLLFVPEMFVLISKLAIIFPKKEHKSRNKGMVGISIEYCTGYWNEEKQVNCCGQRATKVLRHCSETRFSSVLDTYKTAHTKPLPDCNSCRSHVGVFGVEIIFFETVRDAMLYLWIRENKS